MNQLYNCLFIDDNHANNYLTKVIIRIENLPIQPQIFDNAKQALAYLEECVNNKNDCASFPKYIFIDRNMPNINGFSFIEKFEKQFAQSQPQTKIYMLATMVFDEDIEQASNYSSVAGLFEKPFSADIANQVLK